MIREGKVKRIGKMPKGETGSLARTY